MHFNMKTMKDPLEITEAHYRIYNSEGRPATYDNVTEATRTADVVFVGEKHDDPAAHALQAALLKGIHSLYARGAESAHERPVILSVEMFERDVQIVLDEYLAGLIPEKHFLECSRPWGNYFTDYRPLIEFARENRIPVIAANAPRRYVNRVSRLGPNALNDLPQTAKSWLPPLPYLPASPEYRAKLEAFGKMMMPRGPVHKKKGEGEHGKDDLTEAESKMQSRMKMGRSHFIEAQSLWDAAMAFSISEALRRAPGSVVLSINGNFHSEQGMGIPEHLLHYRPGTHILTVTILPDAGFPNFDEKFRGFGDFIIITDPDL
ncbi:ChaN family lipoprotein [Desulfobacterales bacterium HSG2]|nr:ChaN family lipoprotein [Desulfobacterales bacterium HSG2]